MVLKRQQNDRTLELAIELRNELQSRQLRLVLAESCTAGRVAAALGELPGISEFLCGSFVVYRIASKALWLGIPSSVLNDPAMGPVSATASRLLADAALQRTPEADVAVAVTGYIGPSAAPNNDGKVFIASVDCGQRTGELQIALGCPPPVDQHDIAARRARLEEATQAVLAFAVEQLRGQARESR